MADAPILEKVPIVTDRDGVIRVSDTRAPLDTIGIVQSGKTAEYIAEGFNVPLTGVYQVTPRDPHYAHTRVPQRMPMPWCSRGQPAAHRVRYG